MKNKLKITTNFFELSERRKKELSRELGKGLAQMYLNSEVLKETKKRPIIEIFSTWHSRPACYDRLLGNS